MAQVIEEVTLTNVSSAALQEPYQSGASFFLGTMLLSVPIFCFGAALLTDISYVKSADIQWTNFSSWLLAYGMAFIILAILVSIIRYLMTRGRTRPITDWLFGLFLLAAAVTGLFDNFIHTHDGWTSVWPTGLTLTAVTVVLLVIAVLFKLASLSGTYVVDAS